MHERGPARDHERSPMNPTQQAVLLGIPHRGITEARSLALTGAAERAAELPDALDGIPRHMAHWRPESSHEIELSLPRRFACEPLRDLPVQGVKHYLVAYGRDGLKWRTKRLAWEGLEIVAVVEQTVIGEYWDIHEEAMQRFEVDLTTGLARGGVES